jgi:hypothetical protein
MPHRNNPNDIVFDFIEKSVRRYDHFLVGEFWKGIILPYSGKYSSLRRDFFSPITKINGR